MEHEEVQLEERSEEEAPAFSPETLKVVEEFVQTLSENEQHLMGFRKWGFCKKGEPSGAKNAEEEEVLDDAGAKEEEEVAPVPTRKSLERERAPLR